MKRKPATYITFWYLFIGLSWIYLSSLFLKSDQFSSETRALIETLKGYFFVGVTAILLYLLIKRSGKTLVAQTKLFHEKEANLLRAANRKFEMATKATDDIFWERNIAARTIWLSKNFEQYSQTPLPASGWVSEEVWQALLHPDDRGQILASLADTLQGNENVWIGEYKILLPNGEEAYILDKGFIERSPDGTPQ